MLGELHAMMINRQGQDLRGLHIRALQKVIGGTMLAFRTRCTAQTSEV